jgi:Rrf2 family nitric oxide-sensitive transcriptional repressor
VQLSFRADYACRVLIYLAAAESEQSSIEEIASAFHISQNHLVKIVHFLGKHGFLHNTRGRGGGIRLSRPPAEINIGDVIRRTEPSFNVVECFDPETNRCPISGICGLKPWLGKAMEAFLATLDDVTLADVVGNRQKLQAQLFLPELAGDA